MLFPACHVCYFLWSVLIFQFVMEFDRLVALTARGCFEAEVARLRLDVEDAVRLKGEAEKRVAGLAKKHDDSTRLITKLREQVEELTTDKDALNSLVASYSSIEAEHKVAVSKLVAEHEAAVNGLKDEKLALEKQLTEANEALNKSCSEALGAVENGYMLCWNRASEAGLDMSDHTFDRHCEDLARSRGADACSSKRVGSAS